MTEKTAREGYELAFSGGRSCSRLWGWDSLQSCLLVSRLPGCLFGLSSSRSHGDCVLSLLFSSWGSLSLSCLLFCLLLSPHGLDVSVMGMSPFPSG